MRPWIPTEIYAKIASIGNTIDHWNLFWLEEIVRGICYIPEPNPKIIALYQSTEAAYVDRKNRV